MKDDDKLSAFESVIITLERIAVELIKEHNKDAKDAT